MSIRNEDGSRPAVRASRSVAARVAAICAVAALAVAGAFVGARAVAGGSRQAPPTVTERSAALDAISGGDNIATNAAPAAR